MRLETIMRKNRQIETSERLHEINEKKFIKIWKWHTKWEKVNKGRKMRQHGRTETKWEKKDFECEKRNIKCQKMRQIEKNEMLNVKMSQNENKET